MARSDWGRVLKATYCEQEVWSGTGWSVVVIAIVKTDILNIVRERVSISKQPIDGAVAGYWGEKNNNK